ncbi:hypothetical protein GGI21_005897, partial [Coemansia aciculifera]
MSFDRIKNLGFSSGAAIESTEDYRSQLGRTILSPLSDLTVNAHPDVLFVVSSFEEAKPTNGTDFKKAMRCTDPTLGNARETVTWISFLPAHKMPLVTSIGDIVYLEQVKVQEFGGRSQLLSNYKSRWDIVPANRNVDDLHPLVQYLREWWTRAQNFESPVRAPAAVYVDSGVKSQYLKQIFELSDSTRYADLLVEILHVRESDRPNARLCLVTDYSENNQLHDVVDVHTYPRVTGKRLMWCTIDGDIPGMPDIVPNHFYR